MNTKEIYDHLTANMTAEEALFKLLESVARSNDKLKFSNGEEAHPTLIIATAALEMGWNIAIPNDDDGELLGMVVGTSEYIDDVLGNDCDCVDGDCNDDCNSKD